MPAGKIAWDDLVRGTVEIDTANLGGDFVIVRSDGTPLYHFVVVVDDAAMEMTHIIRGEDHISNTPKQLRVLEALGVEPPLYGHLGNIFGRKAVFFRRFCAACTKLVQLTLNFFLALFQFRCILVLALLDRLAPLLAQLAQPLVSLADIG